MVCRRANGLRPAAGRADLARTSPPAQAEGTPARPGRCNPGQCAPMITMETSTSQPSAPRPATRLAYLDTLRAAVVAMVIVHHAALPYGPAGENAWLLTDAR